MAEVTRAEEMICGAQFVSVFKVVVEQEPYDFSLVVSIESDKVEVDGCA